MRAAPVASFVALCLVVGAASLAPSRADAQPHAVPAAPVRSEIDGRINGQAARFVADARNVLLTTAEADRLGIDYRDGRRVAIGGITLWIVTLNSVTVGKETRLVAAAGVVPSIAAYFAALQAHAVELLAHSREIDVQIGGSTVRAFDLGEHVLLLPIVAANRLGLRYPDGERRSVGAAETWRIDLPVTQQGRRVITTVIVGEPTLYFEALQAEINARR